MTCLHCTRKPLTRPIDPELQEVHERKLDAMQEAALEQWRSTCKALGIPLRVWHNPRVERATHLTLSWRSAPGAHSSRPTPVAHIYVWNGWSNTETLDDAHYASMKTPDEIKAWVSVHLADLIA